MSTLRVGTISNVAGTSSATSDTLVSSASTRQYAEFALRGGDLSSPATISANNSTTIVPLTRSNIASGISLNTSTYVWTHNSLGVYKANLSYRQDGGADIWTQYAVRNTTLATTAGTSVRCGSVNSGHPSVWTIVYEVSNVEHTFGVYGWSAGTITVQCGNFGGVSSAWSGTTSDAVRLVIERVS